jgi:chromosome segregation ATPase
MSQCKPKNEIPRSMLGSALVVLMLAGCGPVSDDPREGGLAGYLQHGDRGYQRRLDSRQSELDNLDAEGARLKRTSGSLQQDRSSMQAQLDQNRNALRGMNGELATLERQVASSRGNNQRLLGEIRGKQSELSAMQNGSGSVDAQTAERRKLQSEIADLKERARLLLEVQ